MKGSERLIMTDDDAKGVLHLYGGERGDRGYTHLLVTKDQWWQVNISIRENRYQARYRQRVIEAQEAELKELRDELVMLGWKASDDA